MDASMHDSKPIKQLVYESDREQTHYTDRHRSARGTGDADAVEHMLGYMREAHTECIAERSDFSEMSRDNLHLSGL